MKVIGLGAPQEVRVRFDACEVEVLVAVLREQRAHATRDAAQTYATTPPGQTRAIDDRHDRLRAVEGSLVQLEEQPPDNKPGAVLVADTEFVSEVVRDGAREALRQLDEAYERYEDHATPEARDALLSAATTTQAWVATLTAVDGVDQGWGA